MNMNALQILFFMNLLHMSCVRITEKFVRVLHRSEEFACIVTSVKNSHDFFTGVTNTFEFFTLVTDSFYFHIRTNLSHV